jgi:HCOMODA/2-hydroxy-3-carboxy-muconic semialdehyde decarboxylase
VSAGAPAVGEAEREDVVLANRILAHQGVLDGYGHVSARTLSDPGFYLIGDRTPPGNTRAGNVFPWTLDDAPAGHAHPTYTERFIHGRIYQARPDVGGIVHCHAPELIPYASGGVPLRPLYHMAGFQGDEPLPIFEIRDEFGPETDMLVRTAEQGNALARSLGDRPIVLMRGHGATIVASTIRQAVFWAVYAVTNARVLTQTLLLGGRPTYLTAMEARNIATTNGQGSRTWEYLAALVATE